MTGDDTDKITQMTVDLMDEINASIQKNLNSWVGMGIDAVEVSSMLMTCACNIAGNVMGYVAKHRNDPRDAIIAMFPKAVEQIMRTAFLQADLDADLNVSLETAEKAPTGLKH